MDQLKGLFESKEDFSGVGIILKGKEVLCELAKGYAHRGFQIPNQLDTRFETASITKMFTVVSIFQLIERGLLRLEDQVMDLLGIQGTKIPKEVTIYQLLTHSSGIADDADEELGEDYDALFVNKPNYSLRQTIDYLPQFIYKEPKFSPGEKVSYNNVGYILLGLVIERLTHMTYREYVQKNVFDKAGMMHSGFFSKEEVIPNVAEGYKVEDGKWMKNIYSHPPIGSPDGGAYCTAGDLICFMHCLQEGKLVGDSYVKQIFTPQLFYKSYEQFDIHMGFGFEYKINKDERIEFIRKDGLCTGVAGVMAYYPPKDVTLVIIANVYSNVWKLANELVELI